jgi:ribonuclease HI
MEADLYIQPIHLRLQELALRYVARLLRVPHFLDNPTTGLIAEEIKSEIARRGARIGIGSQTERAWSRMLGKSFGAVPLDHKAHPVATKKAIRTMVKPIIATTTASNCPFNPKNEKKCHSKAQVAAWVNSELESLRINNHWIAFSDASTDPKTLVSGIAARVWNQEYKAGSKLDRAQQYSVLADNTESELAAIGLALDIVNEAKSDLPDDGKGKQLHIFVDSKEAQHCVAGKWKGGDTIPYRLIREIRNQITNMKKTGVDVKIRWVPSHCGIEDNDRVDTLAKEAMEQLKATLQRENWSQNLPHGAHGISLGAISRRIRINTRAMWENEWMHSGCEMQKYVKALPPKSALSVWWNQKGRDARKDCLMARLRYGVCALNESISRRRGMRGIGTCNACDTGQLETTAHFLLHCPKYRQLRNETFPKPSMRKGKSSLSDILAPYTDRRRDQQRLIASSATSFVWQSKRFVVAKFKVQCIRDCRATDNGKEYLIQWENYPIEESTWEPEQSLRLDVPYLIEQFEKDNQ